MIGSTELIIIVLIVFILFGAKSIPKFAKSIGEARKEFQKGMDDLNPNLDSDPRNTKENPNLETSTSDSESRPPSNNHSPPPQSSDS